MLLNKIFIFSNACDGQNDAYIMSRLIGQSLYRELMFGTKFNLQFSRFCQKITVKNSMCLKLQTLTYFFFSFYPPLTSGNHHSAIYTYELVGFFLNFDSTCKKDHTVFVYLCLTLKIMPSRSTHVAIFDKISFFYS